MSIKDFEVYMPEYNTAETRAGIRKMVVDLFLPVYLPPQNALEELLEKRLDTARAKLDDLLPPDASDSKS